MSEKLIIKEITEEEFRNPPKEEPKTEEPKVEDKTITEEPKKEEVKTETPTEEKKEEPKVELPLSEDGSVNFTEEMLSEIESKVKENNPELKGDELQKAIDEQKGLINAEYGRKPKEETPAETEEKVSTSTEDTAASINKLISESTSGEYDSLEKLLEENKTLKEKAEYNYVHPSVQKLNEALSKQGAVDENTIFNFLKVQNSDYSKFSTKELISEAIRLDEPDISTPEIELKLEKFDVLKKSDAEIKEMIEDGDITQLKYDALKNEYERMGRNSLKKLEENKEKLKTSLSVTDKEIQAAQEASQKENQKIVEEFNNKVSKNLPTFTTNKVQVSKDKDGNPVYLDYKVTDEERKQVEATAKNINSFFSRYIDESTGDVDYPKLFSDLHLLDNRDKIIAAATAKTAIETKKSTIGLIGNYSFIEKAGSGSDSRKLSVKEQLSEQYNQKVM